jgi:uncharacterized membrane protein YfcA
MNWLWASLIGAASGILASMGMGGGFVLLVYLSLLGDLDQRTAQGVNLLFFIPIIIISVIIHLKNKLIDTRTALICGGVGAVTVFGGFWIASSVDDEWLRRAFAVFIIIAGLKDLFSKKLTKN